MNEQLFYSLSFFLGSLGLLLLGMRYLSQYLQIVFSSPIRSSINWLGRNQLLTVCSGFLISFLCQSRTSTYASSMSYANSGLLSQKQLSFFLIGANLGSLAILWLFVFDFGHFDLLLIGIGALLSIYARSLGFNHMGQLLLALGFMFLGHRSFVYGLENSFSILDYLSFEIDPHTAIYFYALILLAAIFVLIVRSSVALLILLMALVQAQQLSLYTAYMLVLGINFGGALLGFVIGFRSRVEVQRVMLQNAMTFWLAVIIIYIGFGWAAELNIQLVSFVSGIEREVLLSKYSSLLVPSYHLIFNFFVALLSLVFYYPLRRVLVAIVPYSKNKQNQKMSAIFGVPQMTSSLAVEHLYQEVKKMAAMIDSILVLSLKENEGVQERINKYEEVTDRIEQEIYEYSRVILSQQISQSMIKEVQELISITDHLEGLADSCRYLLEVLESAKLKDQRALLHGFFDEKITEVIADYEHFFAKLTKHEFLTNLTTERLRHKYDMTNDLHQIRESIINEKSLDEEKKYICLEVVDCLRDMSESNRQLNMAVETR